MSGETPEDERAPGPVFTRGFGLFMLAAAVLPGALFVASEWALWHLGAGNSLHALGQLVVFGGTLTALAGSLGIVTLLFFPRTRRFAVRWLASAPVILFSTLLAMPVVKSTHGAGLLDLAARGTPLGEAIRAYERAHGTPPTRLEVLVPSHLPAVPEPGVGWARAFDYRVDRDANGKPTRWRLSVLVPTAAVPDEFYYDPAGPEFPPVGRRIGAWVYSTY